MPPSTSKANLTLRVQPGAEKVLQLAAAGRFMPVSAYERQLLAERLALISGFDNLLCLEGLSFTPFPYQIKAAQTVLRRFRGRGMLCDEVGLGKTIEAGLVIQEYWLRQMIERVLILTPPGLVEQWREELIQKFGLTDFVANTDDAFRQAGEVAWQTFPRVIASLAAARRTGVREQVAQTSYDLVVVDEAHHLKNRSSVSWKFVNSLPRRYLLLLTATPVENKLDELYNLITLLRPGQLYTPQEFRRHFVVRGDPRAPKNRSVLRELLADVMIRHSRSQVNVKLPPRRAHTVRLTLTADEQALYQAITQFVRHSLQAETISSTRRFTLGVLQREIGSSPMAAANTLRKLAEQPAWAHDKAQLLELVAQADRITDWAKWEALLKLIRATQNDKLLIFTHFQATLEALAGRLAAVGEEVIVYHGGLSAMQKEAAIRRFEQDGRILLSTEAAGEGRNLQFCHIMINFDLPWNPQRIEQRVGRLHRVGQTKRVDIFNLSAQGTLEDYLLQILDRKLNMFELVIGEMEMILGYLTEEEDFEELLLAVWLGSEDEAARAAGMDALGERLAQARDKMHRVQAFDETLFGEDFNA